MLQLSASLGDQQLLLDIQWADTITIIIFFLINIKESVTPPILMD
ncbi:hypothetical protein XCR1_1020009 [Xenorhabdus cabanillasii JM26]|uniref:Uncharacterized protein n=1 Tax=Xenorhabdus cabanillasii JM26 TaxID=1427517 RepID=W1IN12_9GAMM|nr:hypothetical protein XCR1_1020009 [Xenorhabdus cabanillasii JM26]